MSRSLVLTRPPPIHPDDLVDPPPASILLDPRGYWLHRRPHQTSGGKRIKVTFWIANPRRCSCFTVYSPDLDNTAFGGIPVVLSTEDDLALLRVPICPLGDDGVAWNNDHFVYQAGGNNENKRPPSLDLIPRAPGRVFLKESAGLLRCCARARDMYFVAVLDWAFRVGQYKLHLYNSKTETWSAKLMYLASAEEKFLYAYSSKVIAIGGELGSIGWVYVRDIIVAEGYIKYFEMCLQGRPEEGGWKAATWERKDSWNEWKKDCVIQVVSKDPAAHTNPDDQQQQEAAETCKEQLPTLKGFYSGYPALSLHNDGVVYIMDRHSLDDTNVTLVAVDMRKQTLKGVADFYSPRPLGYRLFWKWDLQTSAQQDVQHQQRECCCY